MLFLGEFEVSFTGKGRIIIPKKLREVLEKKTVVLTKGFDVCLAGFRLSDWEKGAESFMTPSILEMEKIEMKRHLFSSANVLEIDEQGRIVIPKNLLDYAHLESENALLIGVGTHFEIWNREKWNAYLKNTNIKNMLKKE